MPSSTRRGCLGWLGLILLGLGALLAALILAGCAFQALAEANEARAYPPPGERIDIGGYRLHLACKGEGSPTVILDASFPGQVSNWVWVQPEIAKTTRVCAYDRAGHGWSDPGPAPRDAVTQARELHTLLEKGGVEGPLVLVGHSLGAVTARAFANEYPDQVAGMVLIEGSHPDAWKSRGLTEGVGVDAGMLAAARWLARVGFFRLGLFPVPAADPALPEPQRSEEQAFFNSIKYFELLDAVNAAFPQALEQVRQTRSLGAKPLVIVVGSASENATGVLRELQESLLALSSNHRLVLVEGATHSGLVDDERYAGQTSDAILDAVNAARTGQPLAQ